MTSTNEQALRANVIGQRLIAVNHSQYSEPEFILQGIGPAAFRGHYLTLENGLILDLFIAKLSVAVLPADTMPGETTGLQLADVLGRQIDAVVCDDCGTVLLVFAGGIFLKDANDGCYGNPLFAGRLSDHYNDIELAAFTDYWSGQLIELSGIE